MKKNYQTIRKTEQLSQTFKKSEFICSISRCNLEQEALEFIEQVKKENPKARHHCFAYMIGINDETQRSSDNGEPTGTAGVPILNALKQNQLHYIVAVVTRYFGGIKLGTGGLIRAYSGVTTAAIQKAGIVQRIVMNEVSFKLNYASLEKVKYYLNQNSIHLLDIKYSSEVEVTIQLPNIKIEQFKSNIQNYINKKLTFKIGNERYFDQLIERK